MYVSKFSPKAGAAQEAGAFDTRLGLYVPFAAARIYPFFTATMTNWISHNPLKENADNFSNRNSFGGPQIAPSISSHRKRAHCLSGVH
jgi:hypothetical protein